MKPTRIILHCSDTADSGTVSWEAIRKFHVEQRGWADVGYHYGVELIGDRYAILKGRPADQIGAHCRGQNHDSLGVCFVGKFDAPECAPPAAQWSLGLTLVRQLCAGHGIPFSRVYGHRDFDPHKTCPGLAFDLARFRADLGR
jgi:hypothetical protein